MVSINGSANEGSVKKSIEIRGRKQSKIIGDLEDDFDGLFDDDQENDSKEEEKFI